MIGQNIIAIDVLLNEQTGYVRGHAMNELMRAILLNR